MSAPAASSSSPKPVPDKDAPHHCRACGKVFCHDCTRNSLSLVEGERPQRVCFGCFVRRRGLTDADRRAAAALLPSDEGAPLFCAIVRLGFVEDPKAVFEPVLLVTAFRMHLLRRDFFSGAAVAADVSVPTPFKHQRSFHVFDLVDATFVGRSSVRLTWCDAFQPGPALRIVVSSPDTPQLVHALRVAFQRIAPTLDGSPSPLLGVAGPEACLLPLGPLEVGPAGGFAHSYRAQCNYCGVRPSPEVIAYIEEQAAEDCRVLELGAVPNIEGKTPLTIAYEPLITTLFNNTWFVSVSLNRVNRRGLAFLLLSSVSNNPRLCGLAVQNQTEDPEELVVLGRALSENPGTNVSVINLSGCAINEAAIHGLARGISTMRHGLRRLILKDCKLKPRGVAALVQEGLMQNYPSSCALEELDLSSNKIGDGVACMAIQQWLQTMGALSKLERLSIAATDVSFPIFTRGLNRLTNLRALNVSGNTMDVATAELLSTSCQLHNRLTVIVASNCRISGAGASSLLGAVLSSRAEGCKLSIDLSNNQLDDAAFVQLGEVIKHENVACLSELNISGAATTDKGLRKFLLALSKPGLALRTLVFNNTNIKLSEERFAGLVEVLIDFVNHTNSLTTLSVAGGTPLPMLCGILKGLAGNTSLRELDISRNRLGEGGASYLGFMLKRNSSLLRVVCNDTLIPPYSWESISHDMRANTTLQYLSTPWSDYEAWVHSLTPTKLETFRETILRMQERCALNRAAAVAAGKPLWPASVMAWSPSPLPASFEVCRLVAVPDDMLPISAQPTSKPASPAASSSSLSPQPVATTSQSSSASSLVAEPAAASAATAAASNSKGKEALRESPLPSQAASPRANAASAASSSPSPPQQAAQSPQQQKPSSELRPVAELPTAPQEARSSSPLHSDTSSATSSGIPSPASSRSPSPPPLPGEAAVPTTPPPAPPPPPPPTAQAPSPPAAQAGQVRKQPGDLLAQIRSFNKSGELRHGTPPSPPSPQAGESAAAAAADPSKPLPPIGQAIAEALSKRRLAVRTQIAAAAGSSSSTTDLHQWD